jgi:hypothetical protein
MKDDEIGRMCSTYGDFGGETRRNERNHCGNLDVGDVIILNSSQRSIMGCELD